DGDAGDALLPFGGAGLVDTGALGIDGHRDGHVLDFEFIDAFHAEVFKGQLARADDRLRDEVGGSAYGHQVDRAELLDGLDRYRAAFGLADHAQQAGFGEHLTCELVHARGGGGAGRADNLFANRVDRADVVDEAITEIDREFFAAAEHVGHALVSGIAAGEQLSVQEQDFARFPRGGFGAGYGV